jgi:Tol biopolymer transport system component
MSRFLRFVVEQTLEGRASRIKEYVIATDVFDRPDDYDPQADSTVRTEATKLRGRLNRYYETEGREDNVVISVPKGTYVPVFEDRNGAPAGAPAKRPRFTVYAAVILAAALAVGWIWRALRPLTPSAKLVPLTTYPELELQPSLSPDGSQVAFSWKGDIHVKQVGAEGVMQVTKTAGFEEWPSWSPDGRQIAFVRQGMVFIASAQGQGERRIAEARGRPVWTPDGSALIVTQQYGACCGQSVFRVALPTAEKQRLTFPPEVGVDSHPAVSPDGRTLAFVRSLKSELGDIFLTLVSGGKVTRLTNDPKPIFGLAWTPDGREIVFSSERKGWPRLWRMEAVPQDSAREPTLVDGAGDDARFPWISSGGNGGPSRLVYERFTRDFDIRRAEVIQSRAPGQMLTPSTQFISSTRQDYNPAYSPDGRRIAFISNRTGPRELWTCDSDGSNSLKLTSFGGPNTILPRWSPDGQHVLFSALTGVNGTFATYAIGQAGGTPKQLSSAGHAEFFGHPTQSRDGQWIYFAATISGSLEIWKMPSAGGEPVQITKQTGYRPEESPDGKLLYYGRHNMQGVWSVPVAGGEERRVLDSVGERNWTVAPKGIYYFDFAVAPGAPKLVRFYRFQTGKIEEVGTVEPTVSGDYSGISVSPDGRWLLYSHVASTTSDLMLLDHFR